MSGTSSAGGTYDAIVVGGGHNGLVAAAYLARAGLKPLVLEARDNLGGAATTETPWGPEFKVTALSYVMSLMPPQILRELQLAQHGYEVIPMGPSYIPFPDGRSMLLDGDHADDHAELSEVLLQATPTPSRSTRRGSRASPTCSRPLLMKTPPKVGSKRPGDLKDQLKLAWGMRGLDVRKVGDTTRLFTMSIADLLDDWFESPEVKGMMSINGVIGTWAGPCEPGTAYVMLHHSIGDVGDGHAGLAGATRSAAWARCPPPSRSSARSFGCRGAARTHRSSASSWRTAGSSASRCSDGTEFKADLVRRGDAPADHVPAPARPIATCPPTSSRTSSAGRVAQRHREDQRRHRRAARSSPPTPDMPLEHYTGVHRALRLARLPREGVPGRPLGPGRRRSRSPTRVIPSTRRPRRSAPRARTSCRCSRSGCRTRGATSRTRRSSTPTPTGSSTATTELAPDFKQSVMHRQVIGPYEMEHEYGLIGGNIFHGELTPEQLFHMRPAPGYSRLHDADQRSLPVLVGHARRRRRHRHRRLPLQLQASSATASAAASAGRPDATGARR